MKKNIIQEKSFQFALSIIQLYKELSSKKEYVLSKQLLRSGTSVGANIREAKNAESKRDFIHKLAISQKECDESLYWLDLLFESGYIDFDSYNNKKNEAKELLKILRSIILSTKRNMANS